MLLSLLALISERTLFDLLSPNHIELQQRCLLEFASAIPLVSVQLAYFS